MLKRADSFTAGELLIREDDSLNMVMGKEGESTKRITLLLCNKEEKEYRIQVKKARLFECVDAINN